MEGKEALEIMLKNISVSSFVSIKKVKEIYSEHLTAIIQDLERIEKLKDLEQELGIDLIPLLTVLTNGYAFWKYDNFIYKVQIESITNCCLKVNTWYYVNSNKNGKKYGGEFGIYFKDYGKTWSLTREELEND